MALTSSPLGTHASRHEGELADPTGRSGWNDDPWRRHQVRFFDGRQWTEHVADGGIASIDSGPVAGQAWSRPTTERLTPPTGAVGARVLDQPGAAAPRRLDHPLLLLDTAGEGRSRPLSTPDDVGVGRVVEGRPSPLARMGRALVASPSTTVTRLAVLDRDGAEQLALARPGRRTAATVDVTGPDGRLGSVVAETVRRGIRARVLDRAGEEVGRLTQEPGPASTPLEVAGRDGAAKARLAAVWDVPGARRHLPPGVVVIDRRPVLDGEGSDHQRAALLLGALLAPRLLAPPVPPVDA